MRKKTRNPEPLTTPTPVPAGPVGETFSPNRFPILDVQPTIASGERPIKAVENERLEVRATVFREGHDSLGVSVVLVEADGTESRVRALLEEQDRWVASIRPQQIGAAAFAIEAWDDPWGSWHHRAGIKVPAGVDVELELLEGALLLERALATTLLQASPGEQLAAEDAIRALRDTAGDPQERLAVAFNPVLEAAMAAYPIRDYI